MKALARTRAEFIEKVGQIAQGEGMPRSAGRVFGLLLFDGDAVAFSDLARQLGMSRGSVSSSVRLLEERGVVRRLGRPGDRQDYFQFASTAFTGLLDGAMRRTMRARDQIGESLNALPEGAAGPRARLGAYLSFYDAITGGLSQARERLPCRDMIAQTEKVEEDE